MIFGCSEKAIIDGICYLAQKTNNKELGIHQAMKLLFFADVASMNKTLTPMFGGCYKALKFGPINQEALDIINNTSAGLADGYPLPIKRQDNKIIITAMPNNVGQFLSSDSKKILDDIWQTYKDKNFSELTTISHDHPAWYKAWNARGNANYADMDYRDFYDSSVKKSTINDIASRSAYIAV